MTDIRSLLQRLNPHCTAALESAVGACVHRGNPELRWEHLLGTLADRTGSDIAAILRQHDIGNPSLKLALSRDLATLPDGCSGKPAFSPTLIELFGHGWSISSLLLGEQSVCSGSLLLAALEHGLHAMTDTGSVLRPIDPVRLRAALADTVAGLQEHTAVVSPGTSTPAQALERFCTNLTSTARDGAMDPVLGRDEEIRQVVDILNRRRKNNPILVGEPGVGKTAIAEGLAQRITTGAVPDSLRDTDLWELDMGLLQAGASVKGEFEKRLKAVLDAVSASPRPVVLFIDEAHTLVGAGGPAGGSDAANLLKPALARGAVRTIAATTWTEYRRYFEKDPALSRRFHPVDVSEPDDDTCCTMLRGVRDRFEQHHGVRVTDEAIEACVSLSRRYLTGRYLPDKAVDVLDTACGRTRLTQWTAPASLQRLQAGLRAARLQYQSLCADRDRDMPGLDPRIDSSTARIEHLTREVEASESRWDAERAAAAELTALHDTLAEADSSQRAALLGTMDDVQARLRRIQAESPMVFPYVSAHACAQVVSGWTGVPVGGMLSSEARRLLQLEQRLAERVFGQQDALKTIGDALRGARAGLRAPDAPLAVLLFAGPSGVGKTETAHALARAVYGGDEYLTVINMSEYQESHTASQLKGSPPGYVGYGDGGVLTEAVRRKPYSVVLLDEVEKAHTDVLNMFYQVFDKGSMRDGEGREIDFRNAVIIMTTNLGADTIAGLCDSPEAPSVSSLTDAVIPEIAAHFRPALLGRCRVVPFRPLDAATVTEVVRARLQRISSRAADTHGIPVTVRQEAVEALAERCRCDAFGARAADAVIEQQVTPQLARVLLAQVGDEPDPALRVLVGLRDSALAVWEERTPEELLPNSEAGETEGDTGECGGSMPGNGAELTTQGCFEGGDLGGAPGEVDRIDV